MIKIANSVIRNRLMIMNELTQVYQPIINKNKHKVREYLKDKMETARKSELARKMRVVKGYYMLEMSPPTLKDIEQIKAELELIKVFIKSGSLKYITVKQAFLLLLVGTEVGLWFFLGETIGKMHIVGYKV